MVRFAYGLGLMYLLVGLAGCCAPAHGLNNSIGKHRGVDRDIVDSDEQVLPDKPDVKFKPKKRAKVRDKADDFAKPLQKKKLAALVPVEKDTDSLDEQNNENSQEKDEQALRLLRTVRDVINPQAILFDQKSLKFFVSRLGGAERPEAGAIALLARDGSPVELNWVSGLAQPRGLAVSGDYLYVADGNQLVEIEITGAKVTNRFKIDEGLYFDDVARDGEGNLYISEPLRNTIYRFGSDGQLIRFVQDDQLDGPSRLAIRGGTIYVGSIGLAAKEGGQMKTDAGGLFKIDIKEKSVNQFAPKVRGSVAGLVFDDAGHIYVGIDQNTSLFKVDAQSGDVISKTDIGASFQLSDATMLGDFHYFTRGKEFWMPIKSNGQILVFVESDAALIVEEREGE